MTLYIEGALIGNAAIDAGYCGISNTITGIVPAGDWYEVVAPAGFVLDGWAELR